jgi:hypothetical protein
MNSNSSILIHDVKKQRRVINSYINLERNYSNVRHNHDIKRAGAVKDPTNLPPHKTYLYSKQPNECIDHLNNPYDRPFHVGAYQSKFGRGFYTNQEVRTSDINSKKIINNLGWNV